MCNKKESAANVASNRMELNFAIATIHGFLTTLLDSLSHDKKNYVTLNNMLSVAEKRMSLHQIPFSQVRRRSFWDCLHEDWIEPCCEWVDATDFWPPFPPFYKKLTSNRPMQLESLVFSCLLTLHLPYSCFQNNKCSTFVYPNLFRKKYLFYSLPASFVPFHYDVISTACNSAVSEQPCVASSVHMVNAHQCFRSSIVLPIFFNCLSFSYLSTYFSYKLLGKFPNLICNKSMSHRHCLSYASYSCHSLQMYCSKDRLLLDLLRPLTSIEKMVDVCQGFGLVELLRALECALRVNDVHVKEIACKAVANIVVAFHEELLDLANYQSFQSLKARIESCLSHPHFGVQLAASRAYLNCSSLLLTSTRKITFKLCNLASSLKLPTAAPGQNYPIYKSGVYPVLLAKDGTFLKGFLPEGNECSTSADLIDIVMLHGVRGGASWTWRQNDVHRACSGSDADGARAENKICSNDYTWCWPRDWLAHDVLVEAQKHLRLFLINFPEPFEDQCETLSSYGNKLRKSLCFAGVGKHPIVWIAHSKGGIILKAVLASENCTLLDSSSVGTNVLNKCTAGVIFLSTPHFGTVLAAIIGRLHSKLRELRQLGHDNEELRELHAEFLAVYEREGFPVLSLLDDLPQKILPGIKVALVPIASADIGLGDVVHVEANHLDVCKPIDKSSHVYKAVLEFLLRICEKNTNNSHHLSDASV